MPQQEFAICAPPPRVSAADSEFLLRQALARSNDDPIPRPIGLAAAIPCSEGAAFDADLERLYREIHGLAQCVDRDREVVEIIVDASAAAVPMSRVPWPDLLDALERQFHPGPRASRAIIATASDKATTAEDVAMLGACGFTSVTLGGPQPDGGYVRAAHRCEIASVAVQLTCPAAEPGALALRKIADAALRQRPDRLEILAPETASTTATAMIGVIRELVAQAGYEFIGPEQYALPTDPLAVASRAGRLRYGHFGYTATADCDQLGIGPGAASQVGAFRGRNALRLEIWRERLDDGRLAVSHGVELGLEEQIRSEVRQQLLCRRMIVIEEVEHAYDVEFRRYFDTELASLAQLAVRAHLRDCGDRIEVRSPGWPWLRNIARCFDARN